MLNHLIQILHQMFSDANNLPPWAKAYMAAGTIAGLGYGPKLLLKATPAIIKAVDTAFEMAMKFPLFRWFVLANKESIKQGIQAMVEALKTLADAIGHEIDKDIDEASVPAPAVVPELPKA